MPARRRKPSADATLMIKRGPGGPRAVGKTGKPDLKTMKRLLGYVFRDYKLHFFAVLFCRVINSLSGVATAFFLRVLIMTSSPRF